MILLADIAYNDNTENFISTWNAKHFPKPHESYTDLFVWKKSNSSRTQVNPKAVEYINGLKEAVKAVNYKNPSEETNWDPTPLISIKCQKCLDKPIVEYAPFEEAYRRVMSPDEYTNMVYGQYIIPEIYPGESCPKCG
jgi:hypothetical protein